MSLQVPNQAARRAHAQAVFAAALAAVDPVAAVRGSVAVDGARVVIAGREISSAEHPRRIVSVSIGKAAYTMAAGLDQALGSGLRGGIAVGPAGATNHDAANSLLRWQCLPGSHPFPTEASFAAGRTVLDFVRAHDDDRYAIVFLISGGGSAMLELPIDPRITAEPLAELNSLFLSSGAAIAEINVVRRSLSAIKGGRLAAMAPNATLVSLIVSDTAPGDDASVASGPTIAPPSDGPTAHEVLVKYELIDKLSAVLRQLIDSTRAKVPAQTDRPNALYEVILQNADALNSAASKARELDYDVHLASDISDQEIDAGCRALVEQLRANNLSRPLCLLSGGEFACAVHGKGTGGRNSESALRIAMAADEFGFRARFTALCAGTDGIDGNSRAAGAIADESTLKRARKIGLDAGEFLQRSDSFSFFAALGDNVITGVTGTNVRDIRALFVWPND
jgi:glycerate-2-kinase